MARDLCGIWTDRPRVCADTTNIQLGMHWLRRGERDLFRLPFVFHGHRAEASSNQETDFSPQILGHKSR